MNNSINLGPLPDCRVLRVPMCSSFWRSNFIFGCAWNETYPPFAKLKKCAGDTLCECACVAVRVLDRNILWHERLPFYFITSSQEGAESRRQKKWYVRARDGDLKWHLAKCQPPTHLPLLHLIRMHRMFIYTCIMWVERRHNQKHSLMHPNIDRHTQDVSSVLSATFSLRMRWCFSSSQPGKRPMLYSSGGSSDTFTYISRFGRLPR